MVSKTVLLRDAKAHLGGLTGLAAAGIDIIITRRCQPPAWLTTIRAAPKAIDPAQLRTLTGRMPRINVRATRTLGERLERRDKTPGSLAGPDQVAVVRTPAAKRTR